MTMSRTQAARPESNLEVEHWYLQWTLWYKRIRARFAGVVTRNPSTSKTQGLLCDVNRIRVLSIYVHLQALVSLVPSGAYSICTGWRYIVPSILCSLSWPSCRDESHHGPWQWIHGMTGSIILVALVALLAVSTVSIKKIKKNVVRCSSLRLEWETHMKVAKK